MTLKLGAFGVFAGNMEVMVKFYREVIGLDLKWDGGPFTGVQLDNGIFFNICERSLMDPDKKFSYIQGINGMSQVTFGVDHPSEVDVEFARVVAGGAVPVFPPKTEDYGLRTSFVADPEGNLIEICAAV